MVSASTIEDSLRLISECFSHFKNTSTVGDVLYDELSAISDEALISAVRYLIANETYTPKVADIVSHAKRIANGGPNRAVIREEYIDYWDRSPAERAGIDAAKAEFRRIWQALERGVPVEELYPPDSEPCLLAAEMRRKRGEGVPKTVELAQNVLEMDSKQAASGEREDTREMWNDW